MLWFCLYMIVILRNILIFVNEAVTSAEKRNFV